MNRRSKRAQVYQPIRGYVSLVGDRLETVWEDWTKGTTRPTARIRERIYWDAPVVTEFCVQLEYRRHACVPHADSEWLPVARFDHNVASDRGHDVRVEGLHLDVYGPKGKAYVETGFPDVALRQAPAWCRAYLERNHETYLAEYERRLQLPAVRRHYES